MKIALINPSYENNSKGTIKPNEPVSVQYLTHYISNSGYSCDYYDFAVLDDEDRILNILIKIYDIIGISVFYPFNPIPMAKKIKKANSNSIVIIGGPYATLKSDDFRENENIDFIVLGEGELKLKHLLDYISNNKSIKKCSKVIKNSQNTKNLILQGFPKRKENDFLTYVPSVASSRGCNGKCSFCTNRYMGGWRGRSSSDVVDELEYLIHTFSLSYIQFIEPNFLGDLHRGKQIAREIIQRSLKLNFDYAARIDSINQGHDVIIDLKKAGAIRILLGVENFYDKTLQMWKKEIEYRDIEYCISFLNSINMPYTISLILFHKTLTKEELGFNIAKIEKLQLQNFIDNLFNKLILYPGTLLNTSKNIVEWEFDSVEISIIYTLCLKYQRDKAILLNSYYICPTFVKDSFKIEDFVLRNLFNFHKLKEKDFFILKSLYEGVDYKEIIKNVFKTKRKLEMNNFVFKTPSNISLLDKNTSFIVRDIHKGTEYEINSTTYYLLYIINGLTYQGYLERVKKDLKLKDAEDYFSQLSILFSLLKYEIIDIQYI